jgi:N-acetylmuramic acid 6-phosphate (MurNAc-6-P) etherase
MVALIDASECPPTYGAKLTDFRAYIAGGWSQLHTKTVATPFF